MSSFELGRSEPSPISTSLADPPRIYQAIITRFDLRWSEEAPPVTAEWRAVRLRLMERFLGASLRSQTWAEFEWWILCDILCPAETLTRIRRIDPRVRIALVGPEDEPAVAAELADTRLGSDSRLDSAFPTDADVVISTWFDSDDAMDRRFMEVDRGRVPLFLELGLSRFLVVAAVGYQYDHRKQSAIHRTVPKIAMQTMYERSDMVARYVTGYCGHHGQVLEWYPGFADFSRNAWLWVIHHHNRTSKMGGGVRADMEQVRREFSVEW